MGRFESVINTWADAAQAIYQSNRAVTKPQGASPLRGLVVDPLATLDSSSGYQLRPSFLTYELLERMAHRTTIVRLILGTRINQVALFCREAPDEFGVGFRVVPRDAVAGKAPSAATLKRAGELTKWITACGDPARKDALLVGDNFDTFTRKVVRDLLIYDQMNWQIQERRDGKPHAMIPMAAQSMRIRTPDDRQRQQLNGGGPVEVPELSADDPVYVQIYQGTVIEEFSSRQLVWGVRNPTTNLHGNGYGWSEIEDGIHLCTAWLNSYAYNTRFFGQGTAAAGILTFEGGNPIPQPDMDEFRRLWNGMVTGVENAWRSPIITLSQGQKLNWTDLHKSNREMEFKEWMDLQVRIFASLFLIDPAEFGFPMGDAGGTSGTFANRNENRIKTGKDKGLRPILTLYESKLNTHVIQQIDEDFRFEFIGLEGEDEDTRIDRASKAVATIMMVDEGRARLGLAPLPNKKGEIILNQVWATNAQNIDAGGDEDGDGGGGYEDEDSGGDEGDDDERGNDMQEAAKSLRAQLLATSTWGAEQEAAYSAAVRRGVMATPSAWDVATGAAVAGFDARGGVDAEDAALFGLVVERVGATTLFAKSLTALKPARDFIAAGGSESSAEMLSACGLPSEDVEAVRTLRRLERQRAVAKLRKGTA